MISPGGLYLLNERFNKLQGTGSLKSCSAERCGEAQGEDNIVKILTVILQWAGSLCVIGTDGGMAGLRMSEKSWSVSPGSTPTTYTSPKSSLDLLSTLEPSTKTNNVICNTSPHTILFLHFPYTCWLEIFLCKASLKGMECANFFFIINELNSKFQVFASKLLQ